MVLSHLRKTRVIAKRRIVLNKKYKKEELNFEITSHLFYYIALNN